MRRMTVAVAHLVQCHIKLLALRRVATEGTHVKLGGKRDIYLRGVWGKKGKLNVLRQVG